MKRGVDYIGVGAGAIIVNKKGEFLLCKRGEKAKNEKGKWEFPGGAVEFGETLKNSLTREMKEELNIDIEIIEQLNAIDHIIPDENQHWVTNGFICRIKNGKPKIMEKEKCSRIGWFSLSEVGELDLSIPSRIYLDSLNKRSI